MKLVVDVPTERRYRATNRDGYDRWWRWLCDTVAEHQAMQRDRVPYLGITHVALGEGFVVLTITGEPLEVVDGEMVTRDITVPAPKPPPCWPAGFSP